MAKGGYRPGSGRKKGIASIQAEQTRAAIALLVAEHLEEIVMPQVEKAKKGDTTAFTALMDRAHGKPRQNLGIDGGEDGEPVEYKDVSKMSSQEIDEYLREKLTEHSS